MRDRISTVSVMGLALILAGALLLMGKFHLIHVQFSSLFWSVVALLSLLGAARGFARGKRGRVFWSTVGFLYGLFFLLRSTDLVEIPTRIIVPATFLVAGIAFLMVYLTKVQDWFFLIPAGITLGVGTLFLLANLDYLSYWEVADTLHMYWPVVLIIFGLMFLFRRKRDAGPDQPVAQ